MVRLQRDNMTLEAIAKYDGQKYWIEVHGDHWYIFELGILGVEGSNIECIQVFTEDDGTRFFKIRLCSEGIKFGSEKSILDEVILENHLTDPDFIKSVW